MTAGFPMPISDDLYIADIPDTESDLREVINLALGHNVEKELLHILEEARNWDAWKDRGIAADCLRRAEESGKEAIIGGGI